MVEKEIEKADKYNRFFTMVRKSYLPAFLKFTQRYLDIHDFSSFLGALWTYVEFPNADRNVFVRKFVSMFRKADREDLMNYEEVAFLESLPDEVEVYRGVLPGGTPGSLVWTPDYGKAKWFAVR